VELDVHATADGVIVVHHDPVVGRAADPLHVGRVIAERPWEELRSVQIAPGIPIPSLEEVLALLAGRATVYVEIKGDGIEQLVVDTIRRGAARCAVHSFDHSAIGRVARIAPELRRGILFDEYPADVCEAMRAVGALDVWPRWQLVDDQLLRAVHDIAGRVLTWTVNEPSTVRRLALQGVDGICTDDLRLLGPRAR
jgi:glycerophosphoryl diester phosphodiesterase